MKRITYTWRIYTLNQKDEYCLLEVKWEFCGVNAPFLSYNTLHKLHAMNTNIAPMQTLLNCCYNYIEV